MSDGLLHENVRKKLDTATVQSGRHSGAERPPTHYYVSPPLKEAGGSTAKPHMDAMEPCRGDGVLRIECCLNAAAPGRGPYSCERCVLRARMRTMVDPRTAHVKLLGKRILSCVFERDTKSLEPGAKRQKAANASLSNATWPSKLTGPAAITEARQVDETCNLKTCRNRSTQGAPYYFLHSHIIATRTQKPLALISKRRWMMRSPRPRLPTSSSVCSELVLRSFR